MNWTCNKCGARNNDMHTYCVICRSDRYSKFELTFGKICVISVACTGLAYAVFKWVLPNIQ